MRVGLRRAIAVLLTFVLFIASSSDISAQSVQLGKHDAEVWSQDQVITGELVGFEASAGVLVLNAEEIPFSFEGPAFSLPVRLGSGSSDIFVRMEDDGTIVPSDTLRLTLGFEPRPEVHMYATVQVRSITLHADVMDNPLEEPVEFAWEQDAGNPEVISWTAGNTAQVSFTVPPEAVPGEYYFNVDVTAGDVSVRARTFITVTDSGIHPFEIRTDYASWIDEAIIYCVTPYNFVGFGRFPHITQKIAEIAELGVNTLWIQPVFANARGGQGYDVTNYFSVRSDLGTEAQLRTLIQTAKDHGMRVLLDFMPGQTSIDHPYAKDAIAHGPASHYYDFYLRENDGAPYSNNYQTRQEGEMTFFYYFWEYLSILDYRNPEVRRWIIEAARYWIEEFDIDGYRIDAVWGVNARVPDFMQEWRLALKRIKPEILLLGEDKASIEASFEERFDAAYDWKPGEQWISQWAWEWRFDASYDVSHTVFNYPNQNLRANLLRNALTNDGQGYHPRAKILRFMENNDTPRFIRAHDLPRTKMTAAMMFALDGIPLIYNGQEVGYTRHPYQTFNIFQAHLSIRSQDSHGLFDYYGRLADIRLSHPSLTSRNFAEISVTPGQRVFAFHRWMEDENIFVVVNLGNTETAVQATWPLEGLGLNEDETFYLTDLLTGEVLSGTPAELTEGDLEVGAYTTRILYFSDERVTVSTDDGRIAEVPSAITLSQNYPNPFNPATVIEVALPRAGHAALRVFDVLGRPVATLLDGELAAGVHRAVFDGSGLASGTYFYRLVFGGQTVVRKMMLLK